MLRLEMTESVNSDLHISSFCNFSSVLNIRIKVDCSTKVNLRTCDLMEQFTKEAFKPQYFQQPTQGTAPQT